MMESRDGEVALACPACGWLLAALPAEAAEEVPRCLACGNPGLDRETVSAGTRLVLWPQRPGWAVFSKTTLDPALVLEARN